MGIGIIAGALSGIGDAGLQITQQNGRRLDQEELIRKDAAAKQELAERMNMLAENKLRFRNERRAQFMAANGAGEPAATTEAAPAQQATPSFSQTAADAPAPTDQTQTNKPASTLRPPTDFVSSATKAKRAEEQTMTNNLWKQAREYMALSEFHETEGESETAAKYRASANDMLSRAAQFMPEVQSIAPAKDANGKLVNVVTYKNGAQAVSEFGLAPKMHYMDVGGAIRAVDENSTDVVGVYKKSQTPDNAASNAVTMRGQDMTDARAREANANTTNGKALATASELRKEFNGLPAVKSYTQAVPAYNALVDAISRDNAQADINIVYAIAKLYDPDSVVREGEYATLANSQNIPEKVRGYVSGVLGGGKLTAETRQKILTEAQGRLKSFETPVMEARKNYESIMSKAGVDPSLVFPSAQESAVKSPTKQSGRAVFSSAAELKQAIASGRVKAGDTFSDPDGNLHMVN